MDVRFDVPQGFEKEIERDVQQFARRLRDAHGQVAQAFVAEEAPRDTGALANTTAFEKETSAVGFAGVVKPTRFYALYVVLGTGLFGPLKRLIVPLKAKALRWQRGGQTFFAASVKGQRPNDYIGRAWGRLKSASPRIVDKLWTGFGK